MAGSEPTPRLFHEEELRHLLAREVQRSTRYQDFLSLCLIRAAYPAAPEPAMQAAIALRVAEVLRTTDIVGVLGEDIAVLLVHTPDSEATMIADRVRDRIERMPFSQVSDSLAHVVLSMGLAYFPSDATGDAGLLACAQARLGAALSMPPRPSGL